MRPGISSSGRILLSIVLFAALPQVGEAQSPTPSEDIAALRERVARGNMNAARELGDLYSGYHNGKLYPNVVPVNGAEAVRWYRLCAVEGDAGCQWRLGDMLLHQPASAVEGFNWLMTSAKAGYAWSQRRLAELYKAGIVVKPDPVLALMWFEVSQRHNNRMGGDATAMFDSVAFEIDELVKALPADEVARAREMAITAVPAVKLPQ